ncbi:MAG: DUF3047 domain-containing protein [Bdellovibrionales bacterium]|nr:DUF3047 domain-containing protein [Bdellovibrionales bacterium]
MQICRLVIIVLISFVSHAFADQILENFEHGSFSWNTRHRMNGDHPEYFITNEGDNHFLRAKTEPTLDGNIAAKKIAIDLEKTPYLSWRWRVWILPTRGHEGKSGFRDSGAAVYVYFKKGFFNYILKYVWSSTAPKQAWLPVSKQFTWRTRTIVLESGGPLGEWQTENVNIARDFHKSFGKAPPRIATGIGLLSDSDQTKSVAKADYDDFIAADIEKKQ